eukprot:CAMPEP_0113822370 /NCGR_PEP_ID=MMETSP0328-20130328/2207_1 /TAXON_ID=39455 /ORGANISM="Alexandrium minutum" /LENGTH=262 /DNA_ID=CAMNT_0000790307 /DNA_START=25 /DNA_END=810 /DNA_ORIENTATION=+ /assembly_acc=CAM_ASM_000350
MAEIDTLIFDIDDTMYPMSCGFSDHRNGDIITDFMVKRLGFASREEAKALRDEYFKKYHSTLKGLTVATSEGRLPKPFVQEELGEHWAHHCDFERYFKPDPAFIGALEALAAQGVSLVAFTNSPRTYALRCLDVLGVRPLFPDARVFAVEDVLPACKPEPEAFGKVLEAVGTRPERAVMFEDSMKNIRACKALGMHTVLIDEAAGARPGGEAGLLDDLPSPDDPAVDAVLRNVGEMGGALPCLLARRFEPQKTPSPAAAQAA